MENIKIGLQYLLPKRLLTILVGFIAGKQLGVITQLLIKLFIKVYRVNMAEAKLTQPKDYATFNAFFSRELKEGARHFSESKPEQLVSPVDGCVSQFGVIHRGQLVQAKGQYFDCRALLGGDESLAALFDNGHFATLYLAPQDYHRVHMPCDGQLKQMIYIPGTLFSVSPLTAQNIPNLFARNERLVTIFETSFGLMAQVLVGATIVGSIETEWAGTITPPRRDAIKNWFYPASGANSIHLKKGQQMGAFNLGSTVINLFANSDLVFSECIAINNKIKAGAIYLQS